MVALLLARLTFESFRILEAVSVDTLARLSNSRHQNVLQDKRLNFIEYIVHFGLEEVRNRHSTQDLDTKEASKLYRALG